MNARWSWSFAAALGGQQANVQDKQGPDGFQTGGIYKSTDGGDTWQRINSLNPRPFYYSQICVDPNDENHVYVLGIQLFHSADGGKTFRGDAGNGVHPDHHAKIFLLHHGPSDIPGQRGVVTRSVGPELGESWIGTLWTIGHGPNKSRIQQS